MRGRVAVLRTVPLLAIIVLTVGAMAACRGRDGEREAATVPPVDSNTPASIPSVTAGLKHEKLNHGGLERTYRVYVPAAVASATNRVPLVIGLHGGLGSAEQFAETSQLDTLADREGFISVFPDGVDRTWNGGRCCGQAVTRKIDDVGFLAALIGEITTRYPVDPTRVFVMGHSNGAIMAFRFACERAALVRAIAPVAGSLEIPECKPSRGVNLLTIHGDADRNHPIDGGQGPRSIAGVAFNPMAYSLAVWTAAMRCDGQPERQKEGPLTTTTWTGCHDRTIARYVVIAGADHPWPGSQDRRASALQGEPSQALDATAAAWAFFESVSQ